MRTFVYVSKQDVSPYEGDPADRGLDQALDLLRERAKAGTIKLEERRNVTDEELYELYLGTVVPVSMQRKIAIRRVFGSARRGGYADFGKGVPALLIYEDGSLADIYPHREGDREVSILDYVQQEIGDGRAAGS